MEDRPAAVFRPILSPDTPTMRFNKAPADSQSQSYSAATALPSAIHLIKTVKDALGKISRQTWSIICYTQLHAPIFFSPPHPLANPYPLPIPPLPLPLLND